MSDEFNNNGNDFGNDYSNQNSPQPPQGEQQYQQYQPPQQEQPQQQNYYNPPQNPPQPDYYNANPTPPQEEKASVGLAILSFFIPIAGLIIYLVQKDKKPKTANTSGICALVSFILNIVLSVILTVSGVTAMMMGMDESVDEIYDDGIVSEELIDDTQGGSKVISGNVIDDYVCELKGAEIIKSYDDKDAICVTFNFKNNSDDTVNFDSELHAKAFQDGVELEKTMAKDDIEDNCYTELKPGASVDVKVVYVLSNTTSNVELEIEKWFDSEEGHLEATVTLN